MRSALPAARREPERATDDRLALPVQRDTQRGRNLWGLAAIKLMSRPGMVPHAIASGDRYGGKGKLCRRAARRAPAFARHRHVPRRSRLALVARRIKRIP